MADALRPLTNEELDTRLPPITNPDEIDIVACRLLAAAALRAILGRRGGFHGAALHCRRTRAAGMGLGAGRDRA